MKRIYYSLILLSLMGLSSCHKFLDTTPEDFLNPGNYYTTEDQLNYARCAVYNVLGPGPITGYGNYLLALHADEAYMNRVSMTTGPFNYFYNSADTYVTGFWTTLYDGINRANVVLANVDKNTGIPQAKRDVIRGEMLFLRGYFYFQLATYFGGVPLKIEPTSSIVKVDIPRASLKEVYTQILKDMEAAEPLVSNITTLGYSGAVSKSAVRGILARVNLTMAGEPLKDKTRYAEASKWAKMVIDDAVAGHALNASYPQIFINIAQDKYDIKESIWEVEFWGNNSTQFLEAGNNAWINGPVSNATHGTGVGYMTITSKLYDVFEPGDNRKWWCIAHFNYSNAATAKNGDKLMVNAPVAPNQATKFQLYPAKFRREYETVLPKSINTTPQNNPLLRFSDILLMYAEAENEINNGPTQAAIAAVNLVRQRAWSTGVKAITVTNKGIGYKTAPTVTFSAGVGTDVVNNTAAGTATISGGAVTAINLSRDVTGVTYFQEGQYMSAPTITITGGGGTGATATATIYSKTDANLTPAQTASKQSFLELIQDERMRELNLECLRKADLLRWGIFLQVNQEMGNKFASEAPAIPNSALLVKYYTNVSSKHLLMPIPANECIANRAIIQNPGW